MKLCLTTIEIQEGILLPTSHYFSHLTQVLFLLNSHFSSVYFQYLLQISHSLVVILELSSVSEVQYKEIMMSSINKNN